MKNWVKINTGNANQVLLAIIKMLNDQSFDWTNTIIDCLNNNSIHENVFWRKLRICGTIKTKIGRRISCQYLKFKGINRYKLNTPI